MISEAFEHPKRPLSRPCRTTTVQQQDVQERTQYKPNESDVPMTRCGQGHGVKSLATYRANTNIHLVCHTVTRWLAAREDGD